MEPRSLDQQHLRQAIEDAIEEQKLLEKEARENPTTNFRSLKQREQTGWKSQEVDGPSWAEYANKCVREVGWLRKKLLDLKYESESTERVLHRVWEERDKFEAQAADSDLTLAKMREELEITERELVQYMRLHSAALNRIEELEYELRNAKRDQKLEFVCVEAEKTEEDLSGRIFSAKH